MSHAKSLFHENRIQDLGWFGQLILKTNSKLFIWTKKPTKIFLYFCPSFKKPLKSGRNKRQKY